MKLLQSTFSQKSTSTDGFTLIELLVVIAVIGVLAAIVLIAIDPIEQINRGKDADLKQRVAQVGRAALAAYTSNSISGGGFPPASGTNGQQSLVDSGDLKAIVTGITYTEAGVGSASEVGIFAQLASKQNRQTCAATEVAYACFYANATRNTSQIKCAAPSTNPQCHTP